MMLTVADDDKHELDRSDDDDEFTRIFDSPSSTGQCRWRV
jgi:hypothetical protein